MKMTLGAGHTRRWRTLGILCVSLLLIGLDNTVFNIAVPTLARELSADSSQLQWIIDAYMLFFAGVLLFAGSLGDRFGRKRALNVGLVIFGVSSAAGAFSTSAEVLIIARAVMGIGGAFIMPSTLSILTNTFTDPTERKHAIGVWAGVASLGVALGPAVGGWLLKHYWWGAVLLVNVPITMACLAAGIAWVPESRDPARPRPDPLGALLSVVGLLSVVWATVAAPNRGWTDAAVIAGFVGGTTVIALFIRWELHNDTPMLDPRFFRSARFSAAVISITFLFFALFGSIFILSMYLQGVLGYGALETGVRVLPIAAGLGLGSPLAMRVATRTGEKVPSLLGLLMVAGAFLLLSRTTVESGYAHILTVVLFLGVGVGVAIAPATEAVMGSVPRGKASVGSAINDTTREVGAAFGVAVLGSLLTWVYTGHLNDKTSRLPDEIQGMMGDNLPATLLAAARVSEPVGELLATWAKEAFVNAMQTTALIASAVVLVGALVTLLWLPNRGSGSEPDTSHAGGGDRAEPGQ